MAKRKRSRSRKTRNRPNIPQETLNRARQGEVHEGAAGASPTPSTDNDAEPEAAAQPSASTGLKQGDQQIQLGNSSLTPQEHLARIQAERYERRAAAKRRRSRGNKSSDDVAPSVVANLLANPTKTVSKEDLKAQYNYVITDLRNMGILAAVLFAVLVGLGLWQTL